MQVRNYFRRKYLPSKVLDYVHEYLLPKVSSYVVVRNEVLFPEESTFVRKYTYVVVRNEVLFPEESKLLRKYESTFVRKYFRKYVLRKYGSTYLRRYVRTTRLSLLASYFRTFGRKYESTFVRKYGSTSVLYFRSEFVRIYFRK